MMQLTYKPGDYRTLLQSLLDSRMDEERKSHLSSSIDVACKQAKSYDELNPHQRQLSTVVGPEAKKMFLHCWESRAKAVRELRARVFSWLPETERGRCPYCTLICEPRTLDHFLEKSAVPELALHYRNLIPCCPQCNTPRSTFGQNGQSVLHFYDDKVGDVPDVLRARIEPTRDAITAHFFLELPLPKSALLYERHFQTLDLANRYRRWAAARLPNILGLVSFASDTTDLQRILREYAENKRRILGPNEAEVALHDAVANAPDILQGVAP